MSSQKKRYNIGMNGQSEALMELFTSHDYKAKDVIFDALALFDFAIREIAKGKQIGALSSDGKTMNTVVTPILLELEKNPEWLREYAGVKKQVIEHQSADVNEERTAAL